MSDNDTGSSGSMTAIVAIIAIIVILGIGYLVYQRGAVTSGSTPSVKINLPAAGNANS